MTRSAIEAFQLQMEAAYRGDPFHALRTNLEAVTPELWEALPAKPIGPDSEFGRHSHPSIRDLVLRVAGAKHMYADHIFGNGSMEWGDLRSAGYGMEAVLQWLDDGHRQLTEGLKGFADDAELAVERMAPWKQPRRTDHQLIVVINHDLYHAGEINRQRSLIVGTEGWEPLRG
jgi:uncharacterized damage-inducible protein DinB